MSLKDRISEDMKSALRAGDKLKLGAVRMVMAAVQQREVDTGVKADDGIILDVLSKMVKQRRDSLEQFEAAGRADLVEKESQELAIVQSYLPEPLAQEEIERLIGESIASVSAAGMRDMGKVMASLKPQLTGRADMGLVSAQIKSRLSSL